MADRELGVSELGLDAVDHRRRGGRSRKSERQPSRCAGSSGFASSESFDEVLRCASAGCVDSPRAIPASH
jgi:hypothetical protein